MQGNFNKEKWSTAKVYIQPIKSTSSSTSTHNAGISTTSSYVSSTPTPPPASKTSTTSSSPTHPTKTTNTPNTIPTKRGRGRPRKEQPSNTQSNKRRRAEHADHKLDSNPSLSLSSSTSPTSSIRALDDDGDDDDKSDMMIIEDHHYHKIYVNQASMAIASPKWHTMFNNNWMESKQKQIILEVINMLVMYVCMYMH